MEELFQRIKSHLAWETARTGQKLSQRTFVLGLTEQVLNEAEAQGTTGQPSAGDVSHSTPDELNAENEGQEA